VIWDAEDLLESQISAIRDLPLAVPALTAMQMTDKDLAHLDAAADTVHYHLVLGAIVARIQKGTQHE
jgi:hypothetical protein